MLRATLAVLLLAAPPALAQDLGVHDPYALTTVPGASMGTAYMLIHNHASAPDRLLAASSPAAERVQIHTSVEEDGVVSMEHVEEGLELRPGSVLLLNRGGPHLMFLGLTDPWEDGDVFPVTLVFENAGEVTVEVPVDLSRLTDEAGGGMDHDHGDAMDHGDGEATDHEGYDG
jgi:periplasmic copper chaperone A